MFVRRCLGRSSDGGALALAIVLAGCGGGGTTTGAVAARPDGGGSAGIGGAASACADLFDPGTLQSYSIDISPDEWTKMEDEFRDIQSVLAGTPRETYHPVTFRFGSETVANAAVRLKGQSSWVETVMFDANPKMQFVIAFDQVDPKGNFHGVDKIHLDMPRSDWSFLNSRLSNSWLREVGLMAPCSNSARLSINGAYYGLYTSEGPVNGALLERFFPGNGGGDLFKGGSVAETNQASADWTRLQQLWDAKDIAAMEKIVDLPSTVLEWAAEAAINDADGYYGGSHNFYLYDEGAKGYTWLANDVDTTFGWTGVFSSLSFRQHPIYWWADQPPEVVQPPGQHYLIVMNDPTWRARYVQAVGTQVGKWDTARLLGWVDAWSAQIAGAVAEDPHKAATTNDFNMAIAATHEMITNRPMFLKSFVACEQGSGGDDNDGDGVPWCNDCRDEDPTVHPGVAETCGNGIDDDCNGVVDDGCPAR